MDFAVEAIASPKGRHASTIENVEYALEHMCFLERRLDFSNENARAKPASSGNSAVLFFWSTCVPCALFAPFPRRCRRSEGA